MTRLAPRLILAAIGVALASAPAARAQIFFTESFESPPPTTYTLTPDGAFDDGFFDFWNRYAVPDADNSARDNFTVGLDGAFAIMGQDLDGDGNAATQVITIPGIDISGRTNLVVGARFGANDNEGDGFDNYEMADGDGIEIFATIDGGARTQVGRFSPPATGSGAMTPNAGDLYLDPDLDGVGTGTRLTVDLALVSFAIPGTGSDLTIEIECTSTDSFEMIVVDGVVVGETFVPVELQGFSVE